MDPLVTIIVPAKNSARTISRTLRSVVQQTYDNWECVVIDDGSSDKTLEIVLETSKADRRISSVMGAGKGVSSARNLGLAHSSGELVVFLDSDDWISPNYLKIMCASFKEHPAASAVYCAWQRVTEDGRLTPPEWPSDLSKHPFEMFARYCAVPIHSILVKRAAVDSVGWFNESLWTCEDWDLWQRVSRAGHQFVGVNEPLTFYRMNAGSLSQNAEQMVADAANVIGCAFKESTTSIFASHSLGADEALGSEQTALMSFIVWAAAVKVGGRTSAAQLLLRDNLDVKSDVEKVSRFIFDGLWKGARVLPSDLAQIWPTIETEFDELMLLIEAKSSRPKTGTRVRRKVERYVLDADNSASSRVVGSTASFTFDVARPKFTSISTTSDRLLLKSWMAGHPVTSILIPVYDDVSAREIVFIAAGLVGPRRLLRASLTLLSRGALPSVFWTVIFAFLAEYTKLSARYGITNATVLNESPNCRKVQQLINSSKSLLVEHGPRAHTIQREFSTSAFECSQSDQEISVRDQVEVDRVPVLMYHRIADDGPEQLKRFRTSPRQFAAQMAWLKRNGYYTVTISDIVRHCQGGHLRGRPVLITFDDATIDFFDVAFPVLARHRFGAQVFAVTALVGKSATWDSEFGTPSKLMTDIQILETSRAGIEFGSHLSTHRAADGLSNSELLAEMVQSQAMLQSWTQKPCNSLALPYGAYDERARYLAPKCGYQAIFTTRDGSVERGADPLSLPRIEVRGDWEFAQFTLALNSHALLS
ncbi:glycosyltransferase [Bradyrhizobium sp. B117]|uniref:glycosyltransferase n=1 Tax=Bradyrhizobium sp. B117 TaxID=3140246 RepID=UPI00318451B4